MSTSPTLLLSLGCRKRLGPPLQGQGSTNAMNPKLGRMLQWRRLNHEAESFEDGKSKEAVVS